MKWVQLSNGIRMAYQEWGSKGREKILALHGWLDNSNSFKSLGPLLAENGYHVVAADHIGHGRSDHIGVGAYYSILNTTSITREFTSTLGWNSSGEPRYHVLGHSMGATISMIYAATFHENLAKLVMMEGFGPIVENDPAMTPHNFRKACEAELSMKQRYSGAKVYKTLQDTIDARIKSVKSYPGSQYISEAAAAEIVSRAVKLDGTQNSPSHNDINDRKLGPLQFTHDPRLLLPSYIYHSEEQVFSYAKSIQCPSLLITAEDGWPSPPEQFLRRKQVMEKNGKLVHHHLPGSHHFHLDPEHSLKVANTIVAFLKTDAA